MSEERASRALPRGVSIENASLHLRVEAKNLHECDESPRRMTKSLFFLARNQSLGRVRARHILEFIASGEGCCRALTLVEHGGANDSMPVFCLPRKALVET